MDNTARNYESYAQPQIKENPQQEPSRKSRVHTKSVPVSKLESVLLMLLGLITMVLMVALVSVKVSTTVSQQQLQKINNSVDSTISKNVDLRQEVGELTSSQRLTEYAQTHNMTLNNDNVRNVSK